MLELSGCIQLDEQIFEDVLCSTHFVTMKYKFYLGFFVFVNLIAIGQSFAGISNLGYAFKNRNWVASINGRPIDFYLSHSKIDVDSKRFFKGELPLSIDYVTNGLLDSILTKNLETRPFYFFVFNQVVDLSDNNLASIIAPKCLELVQTQSSFFFNAFNQPEININVVKWTTYIGQTLKDRNQYLDFKSKVDSALKGEPKDILDLWKSFLAEVRMCLVR